MTTDMHALSGAYAMDALDEQERLDFEAHLDGCAQCREEATELMETAALLSHTSAVPPRPELRAAVMDSIATTRPLPPPTATVITMPRRRRTALWVAAAVAAVTIGGGLAVTRPWQEPTPQVQLSAADRVLQAADAERVRLAFPDGSSATFVRSVSEGRAVVQTSKMAAPPAGKVYEIWWQHQDGSMTPAALMPRRPDNTVLLDGDAAAVVGAGITIEPAGGSTKPSGDPIALFDLTEAS